MSWLIRVVVRRSFVQVPILAGVTALAVAACTLLGSVTALVSSLDGPVTGALLAQADREDTALEATLRPRSAASDDAGSGDAGSGDAASTDTDDTASATALAEAAIDNTLRTFDALAEDIPLSVSVWRTSEIYRLGTDRFAAATYLAAPPSDLPMEIVAGTAPDDGTVPRASTGDRIVPVVVPNIVAAVRDWQVGEQVTLDPSSASDEPLVIEITGLYEPARSGAAWDLDLLAGQISDPDFWLRAGGVRIELYGPLITSPDALNAAGLPLSEAVVSAAPDLSGTTAADAAAFSDRVELGEGSLSQANPTAEVDFESRLDRVVGAVASQVGVTRTIVLMSGLVLLVIAGAALRLVARFLAEQRADGLELLDARGASRAQLVRLTVVEAAGVAIVVALVSPWLAVGLLGLITRFILRVGDGASAVVPLDVADPLLWGTCVAAAVALAAFLVVPVLRSDFSGESSGAPAHRPGRAATLRAALLDSGGTVMLIVLAGVAVWQLAVYRTATSGGDADPVVVAAPALLLLATALVIARCLPVLARLTDRIAARSRRLAVPLAAWETGRRPGRAAGTVLLLTLAVSVAVAVPPTLATWRTSQVDQAEFAVGAPARLSEVSGGALEASGRIADAVGRIPVAFQPVTDRPMAVLGAQGRGRSFRLLGLDDAGVLRGRLIDAQGPNGALHSWDDVGDLLAGDQPAREATGNDHTQPTAMDQAGVPDGRHTTGIEIPAGSVRIEAQTVASAEVVVDPDRVPGNMDEDEPGPASSTQSSSGTVRIDLILEDVRGVREQLTFDGREFAPAKDFASIPLRTGGAPLAEPMRLVGMTVTIRALDFPGLSMGAVDAEVHAALSDLQAVDESGSITPLDFGQWQARSIPAVSAEDSGDDLLPLPTSVRAPTEGASITLTHELSANAFLSYGTRFALAPQISGTAFPGTDDDTTTPIPAVVTSGIAAQEEISIGDTLRLDGPAPLALAVVGTVRHLPGGTGEGILVRRDLMHTAQLAEGSPLSVPDEWWAKVADDDTAPLTDALAGTGHLRILAAEREAALSGPLNLAIPTALGLLAAAAVLLAGAGVAAGTTSGLRLRRLEIARLQALGVPRRLLTRAVLAEYGMLGAVSLLGGAITGAILTLVLAPVTVVGPDGGPPVPDATTVVPWGWLLGLGGVTTVVVGLVVAVSVRVHVRRASADLMRLGTDR